MLTIGLLSVTFRKLTVERIVELTQQAGLSSIEWGGDVHVPHGDTDAAKFTRQITQDAGLSISAYGSYYRLNDPESPSFDAVMDSAEALGAPLIRVWAGKIGSQDASERDRQAIAEDAQRICEFAQKQNIRIALEYHRNTLTDTLESTQDLLKAVAHDNLYTFWQPPHTRDPALKVQSLESLLPV